MKIKYSFLKILSFLFFIFSLIIILFLSLKLYLSNNFDYYIDYLISIILVSFFYFINLFTNARFKIYVAITTISLLFSFYLFEAYLVYDKNYKTNFEDIVLKFEKKNNIKFDRRSKYEIYTDLSKTEDVTVSITPYNLRNDKSLKFLPLSGISKSKTIMCNESGYYSIINTDKYGFNNPQGEFDKKNIFAILVGDSFVHGSCVNPPHDLGGVIRRKIDNNQGVLNLGQSGNAPLTQYATLVEYLDTSKNIENVIWFHYEANDLHYDFQEELNNQILQKYFLEENFSQNLIFKQNKIDNFLKLKINSILNSELKIRGQKISNKILFLNFIKLNNLRFKLTRKSKVDLSAKLKEFEKIMVLTKKITDEHKAKLHFVYLPSFAYYDVNKFEDKEYEKVKNITKKLNIPFIDIDELVFKKEKYPKKLFALEIWNHYTIDGYDKVGSAVFENINKIK